MAERFDVAVVGAGAAGLMAAIFAARQGSSVVALDGAARVGAKILIAGGGRCNVTHHAVNASDFNGGNRNLIGRVLRSFDVSATVAFFHEIGVELKREPTGKLFPVTDRAVTVLDALLDALVAAGAELRAGARVTAVRREGEGFAVDTSAGAFEARSVILATGGRSVPKTGSDGAGYALAQSLGHSVTPLFPALVPLLLPPSHWLRALSGISVDVELSLQSPAGKTLQRVSGAMLFTHFGLSGPAVLDMSRHWIAARKEGATLAANLTGASFEETERALLDEASQRPTAAVATLLRRWFPERLAEALASQAGAGGTAAGRLTREGRRKLVHMLTSLPLPVTGDRGFDYAEVTAGGVPLEEADAATMESKVTPRLFLCGEILDVDGRIGGFNFQWAWASGRLAGMSAALGMKKT